MKVHIQPNDGIGPVLQAIAGAKKSIEVLIFRFDRAEVEKALVDAARRGVTVTALIAFTNRGEERNLRKLEMRFLAQGITVARTADDLVRYHGKMMIVDGRELWVLGFNLTHLDINLSRSFAVVTRKKDLVQEAAKLFACDMKRQPYSAGCKQFIVSPVNSRKELKGFIEGAKKQLLIYELKISDPEFVKLLEKKSAEGVDVRIVGRVGRKATLLNARPLASMRLHVRSILRDGKQAFLGSMSMRKLEMEARREIGILFDDAAAVKKIAKVFEEDWEASVPVRRDPVTASIELPAKKVAKAIIKNVPVEAMVEQVLEKVIDPKADQPLPPDEVAQTVHDAVKDAVKVAVAEAVRDMAAQQPAAAEQEPEEGNGKKRKATAAA